MEGTPPGATRDLGPTPRGTPHGRAFAFPVSGARNKSTAGRQALLLTRAPRRNARRGRDTKTEVQRAAPLPSRKGTTRRQTQPAGPSSSCQLSTIHHPPHRHRPSAVCRPVVTHALPPCQMRMGQMREGARRDRCLRRRRARPRHSRRGGRGWAPRNQGWVVRRERRRSETVRQRGADHVSPVQSASRAVSRVVNVLVRDNRGPLVAE